MGAVIIHAIIGGGYQSDLSTCFCCLLVASGEFELSV